MSKGWKQSFETTSRMGSRGGGCRSSRGYKSTCIARWWTTGGAALMYNFGQEARSIVLDGPPWEPSVIVLAGCANDTKRKSSSVH